MGIFASIGDGLRRGWPWTGVVGAVVVGGLAGGLIAAATQSSSSSNSKLQRLLGDDGGE